MPLERDVPKWPLSEKRLHCNDVLSPGLFCRRCPHYHSRAPVAGTFMLSTLTSNRVTVDQDRGDRLAHVPDEPPESERDAVSAVVLGLGINGLGVVRALGRAGLPVVGLFSPDDRVGSFSRYCRAICAPVNPSTETLQILNSAVSSTKVAVLLPTSDAYAHWINEHQKLLRPRFRFHTVRPELFERLNSKIGVVQLAREHGIEVPATAYFSELPEFEHGIAALRFPILVKPIDTFRRNLPDRSKNKCFKSAEALIDYVRLFADLLPNMVFQEVVPSGDGHIHVCTLLLDQRGELVLSYTGRKIRQYPPDFGNTCFGVSEQNDDLLRLASRFLRVVGYQGLCTLEFARHRQTGRFVLLETNLRSYLHNQLFYDCGLNFPLAEYRLLTGGPLPEHRTQRNGIHWLYFTRDAGSFYRRFGAKEIDSMAWIRSLPRARSFAAFALDDLLPWIYETARLLRRIWSVAARTVRHYANVFQVRARPGATEKQ